MNQEFIYNENVITFQKENEGGIMINATEMAKPFEKRVNDWSRLSSTSEFLNELSSVAGIPVTELIKTVQGGTPQDQGTWMHEDVALEFARWLSPMFAIWCNRKIKELLLTGRTCIEPSSTSISELSYHRDEPFVTKSVKVKISERNLMILQSLTGQLNNSSRPFYCEDVLDKIIRSYVTQHKQEVEAAIYDHWNRLLSY